MFKSVSMKDQIRIPPADLNRGSEVVADAIDMKYANRVIPHVGLVLGLFAVDSVSDAFIHPGDGGLHAHGAYTLGVCVGDLSVATRVPRRSLAQRPSASPSSRPSPARSSPGASSRRTAASASRCRSSSATTCTSRRRSCVTASLGLNRCARGSGAQPRRRTTPRRSRCGVGAAWVRPRAPRPARPPAPRVASSSSSTFRRGTRSAFMPRALSSPNGRRATRGWRRTRLLGLGPRGEQVRRKADSQQARQHRRANRYPPVVAGKSAPSVIASLTAAAAASASTAALVTYGNCAANGAACRRLSGWAGPLSTDPSPPPRPRQACSTP